MGLLILQILRKDTHVRLKFRIIQQLRVVGHLPPQLQAKGREAIVAGQLRIHAIAGKLGLSCQARNELLHVHMGQFQSIPEYLPILVRKQANPGQPAVQIVRPAVIARKDSGKQTVLKLNHLIFCHAQAERAYALVWIHFKGFHHLSSSAWQRKIRRCHGDGASR